ncbi:MAG: hypothetical protein IT459_23455 [Planctomycetes bacterium]|nr:hypothetical protein [Planctomycetota bacterium]
MRLLLAMEHRIARLALLVCLACLVAAPFAWASPQKKAAARPQGRELADLYAEESADRKDGARRSEKELAERRKARLERLDGLIRDGRLATGQDCYYAGRILSRDDETADRLLLGHTLFTVAALQKVPYALDASVETLDRWLLAIEQPQQLCSVLDGDGSNAPPTAPFDNRVHQSIRAEFGLEPLHFDDERPEPKGKKPKGFNSKELQRLDRSLHGDPKEIRPVDPVEALERARKMIGEGGLTGASDHFAAARLLARSERTSDLAISHALAVLAATKEQAGARELVAGSLDALLRSVKQPEAFGSALTSGSHEHAFDAWGPPLDELLRKNYGLRQIERTPREAGASDDE